MPPDAPGPLDLDRAYRNLLEAVWAQYCGLIMRDGIAAGFYLEMVLWCAHSANRGWDPGNYPVGHRIEFDSRIRAAAAEQITAWQDGDLVNTPPDLFSVVNPG